MDCSDTEDAHCYNSQALLSNLKELNTKIKNGEKIDGINISLSLNMDYKKINSMKNTHFNLKSKNPEFLTTLNAIKTIEKITSNNVPVFVAAGNYDDSFNALGLADKTTVVGGTYRNTKVSMFSQNSTVNAWDESIWPVNPIISDDKKVVGYDVTNDGILDIPASATSSNGKCEKKDITIGGTSIAAPNHFRKYLEQR